ncbi:MAG: PilZ domain-containing protein [Spirochaetaceae bacterium]|nr:MAG: PilZ domain-containing protein [Spirochaetaceae bacterium]
MGLSTSSQPVKTESERRRLSRFQLEMPAVVIPRGRGPATDAFLSAQTRDISANGAFLCIDHPPGIGTRITIEMQTVIKSLPELVNATNQVKIRVDGKVVRHSRDGVGVRFDATLKFRQDVQEHAYNEE